MELKNQKRRMKLAIFAEGMTVKKGDDVENIPLLLME